MNEFDRFRNGENISVAISWLGFHQVPFFIMSVARIAGETEISD